MQLDRVLAGDLHRELAGVDARLDAAFERTQDQRQVALLRIEQPRHHFALQQRLKSLILQNGSHRHLIAKQRLEREYQATWYKILQRRGDKVPANASMLVVDDSDKPAMLEGIYRARLKQQPPAEWQQLSRDERTAKLHDAVIKSWAESTALLRQLGQDRAGSIKDYLVDKGQLEDDRVYFIDTNLGQAESDGRVITPLHLDAE